MRRKQVHTAIPRKNTAKGRRELRKDKRIKRHEKHAEKANEEKLEAVLTEGGEIGFQYATSYEIDGELVRIKGNQGDLLFKIEDSKTLKGENLLAQGIYIKVD